MTKGQKGVNLFGIQIKPIIPTDYFNAGPITISDTIVSVDIVPKVGYSFGMVVRHNFTDKLSFETGINSVRRNYNIFSFENKIQTDQTDFGFINYEIPLQGLFYIQLSKYIYMNASTGIGINWYATNVESLGENYLIDHYSYKARWMGLSYLGNLGFEYRTKKNGTFYLGGSYVNPFSVITITTITYEYDNNFTTKLSTFLNGNYLTLDLRWFFPENKESKN